TTLVPALIKNILYNVSHDNRAFRLFEISRVFFAAGMSGVSHAVGMPVSRAEGLGLTYRTVQSELPKERNHFAAALYKEKIRSYYKDDTHDFFVVKGVIEALFDSLKITSYSFARSSEPFLHPGQSADVLIGGEKIGYVGALSPVIIDRLDIKAQNPSIILAELNVDLIRPHSMQVLKYHPLPRYPYSERDTALVVDEALESAEIVALLKSYSTDLIDGVTLFDVFQGKNIPEGKKSIAFSIRYRASDRTLKDEEVDALQDRIIGFVMERTKGQLRS